MFASYAVVLVVGLRSAARLAALIKEHAKPCRVYL